MRHRHSISAIRSARAPGRGAFTLIEMMVAVSILAILIVIFGGILSQIQRAINRSNDAIRIDRTVAALDKLIRRDVSSMNKGGFLKITEGRKIAFTVVGSFESRIELADPKDPAKNRANAAIIDYGRLDDTPANVLWRRVHLLKPELTSDTGDMLKASLAESTTTVEPSEYTDPAEISLPPTSAEDWADYVAGNCTDFKVFWWNGEAWSAEDGTWTAANPDNWPEAVRVQFRLEDRLFEVVAKIE